MAEDPGAPSFVRLARAYRREGRGAAARDIVMAGLTINPEHVDAHALLALLHVEDGDRQQARDEWETVLRLDPGNFDASRGLGFLALERGDLRAARRHLDLASQARPDDPAVSKAREVLDRRERDAATDPRRTPMAQPAPVPAADTLGRVGAGASAGATLPGDPVALFSALAGDSPFRGALLLDEQGLVLAGRLEDENRRDDLLGAVLNTVVAEARRTAGMLRLGDWDRMLLETADATLHLGVLQGGAVVVVVAARGAPAGWVVRIADRARALADRFLGEGR